MRSTLLILISLLAASLAVPTLPQNLFFYSKLESVQATDETGRQSPATLIGNPTVVPGYNGNGVRFNNGTDATDALNFGVLAISGPVTYSVWFKLESLATTNGKVLSNKADYSTDDFGNEIEIDTTNNNNLIKYVHGAQLVDGANIVWATGVWYHIAVVGSADAATVIYVNGTAQTNSVNSGNNGPAVANPTKFFSVGSSTTASNNAINQGAAFRGVVDEVRVYNTTLTADQVKSIFAETFVAPVLTSTSTSSSTSTSTSSTQGLTSTTTFPSGFTTFPSGLTAFPSGFTGFPSGLTTFPSGFTGFNGASTSVVSFFVVIAAFLFAF